MSLKQIEALKKLSLGQANETNDSSTTSCICNRPVQDVLCHSCGFLFVGRVRTKCTTHPQAILLMDNVCCPKCRTDCLFEIKESATPTKKSYSRSTSLENATVPLKVDISDTQKASPLKTQLNQVTIVEAKLPAKLDSQSNTKPKLVDSGCQTEFPLQIMDDNRQSPLASLGRSDFQGSQGLSEKTPVAASNHYHPVNSMQQKREPHTSTWQNWNGNNPVTVTRPGISDPQSQQLTCVDRQLRNVYTRQSPFCQNKSLVSSASNQNAQMSGQRLPQGFSHGYTVLTSSRPAYIPRQPVLGSTPDYAPQGSRNSVAILALGHNQQTSKPVTQPKLEIGSGDVNSSISQKVGVSDECSILKRAIELRRSSTPEYADRCLADRQF